jgi:hypothetical protein
MRVAARAALSLSAMGITIAAVVAPMSPALAAAPTLSVSPNTGLHDAESVTVTGSSFAANKTFYMVECSGSTEADCDTSNLVTGTTTASGGLSTSFTVHTGAIGAGTCTTTSTTCSIAATTDPNPSDTAAAARTTISFGTASSGPTITVTPNTGVKNNTTVSVSGKGFPANKTLYVIECGALTGQAACDVGTLNSSSKTSSSGAFSKVKVKVHTGKVGNKSCVAGGKCYIAAATSTTPSASSSASATFTFAKPPSHPALTVKPSNGAVNGGRVRVSGRGFPAGRRIDLMECSSLGTTLSCDVRTFTTSGKTNANGAFKTVNVRVYAGKKTKRSCKGGGKCYLIIGTTSNTPNAKNTTEAFFSFATKKATRVAVVVHGHHLDGQVRAAGRGVAGLKALIERKVGNRWKKVAKLTTHHRGAFTSRGLAHAGKYRVFVPRQRLRGTVFTPSTSKTVRIH